eukprot:3626905-Rhodomonas_salina.2
MSGTASEYAATRLSPDTDIDHAPKVSTLRTCYARCGTDLAYGATPYLYNARYGPSVWCYSMPMRGAVLT